jgi:hypothetical protein
MHTIPNLVIAAAVCTQASAQSEATSRCQLISDASARLACYDVALPPKREIHSNEQVGQVAAPVTSAKKDLSSDQFGLPQKPKDGEAEAIESAVDAGFYGWGPNDRIRLQNGQVWVVVDGTTGTTTGDMRKVKVRRGALGSFFLDFEGLNKSPRVRRVQ